MHNIALKIRFDGTGYHGWQVQKSDITVAGTLETALSKLCGHKVKVSGCGRTDAGVHAEVYCANFRSPTGIPPERLPYAINVQLPRDIAVQNAMYVPDDFDANLSCVKKEYTYRIICSRIRDPLYCGKAYFYPRGLNLDEMRKASKHFVGTHDFAAVRSMGTVTKTTVRTVHWYEIENVSGSGSFPENTIALRVCANGFLYNMARAMAGTLIYVSEGKLRADDIPALLEQKDRRLTGPTVPPDGLYLTKLWYEGAVGEIFTVS